MDDYTRTFDTRGGDYNQAGRMCPDARRIERRLLIDRLRLDGDLVVCDVPAGGGYLADGIVEESTFSGRVICVEPSHAFAKGIDERHERHVAPLEALPLADVSVDRVGSLAGLHHLDSPAAFFDEAFRVLKPGGRIAVADALDGSPQAVFLNDAVNRLTHTGHEGRFFARGAFAAMLADAGFTDIEERHESFAWTFTSVEQMATYCRTLFGMFKADAAQVRAEIEAVLPVRTIDAGVELGWSLLYASGVRPGPQ